MAPKLYTFRSSAAVRSVLITAKALGIALDRHELDWTKAEHRSPEYLKLNPQHSVPTLDDDGKVICDSHAISAYLVGKYGKDDSLYPKDLYRRALVDQKLAFNLGVLAPLLRTADNACANGEIKSALPKLAEYVKEAYGFLEKFLEGKQWISADCVTIGDFSCVTTITCLEVYVKIDPKTYPNTTAWIKRAQALPCFASDHEGLDAFKETVKRFIC